MFGAGARAEILDILEPNCIVAGSDALITIRDWPDVWFLFGLIIYHQAFCLYSILPGASYNLPDTSWKFDG
jgi:hypothetical protein